MTDCKHDWHFIEGTERLQCRRCKAETGPRTYDQLTQNMLQDVLTMGSAWSKDGERIDPMSVYAPLPEFTFTVPKPNYNITFHRHENGVNGKEVGKLDFNGPEMVFTGDAAESAKVFIDWVANTFHGRLKEEREAGKKEAEEVTWGIDWGRAGEKSCATIIKRLPGGKIEVVAVEYEP
jgi:hypothetical protein